MIKGFEDITQPLTDDELALVDRFVSAFSKRIGLENAITSHEIIKKMAAERKLTGATIRKLINHIRNGDYFERHILKATSRGYYLTDDPEEIAAYVVSLDGRINAIKTVRDKIMKKLIKG